MVSRALLALLLGAPFVAAAVGCSIAATDETDSRADRETASGSVLESVLQLEGGCTAAKVGPRQLLVAARCATGFAAGQTITFTSAAEGKIAAAPTDAAAFDASANDAGGDASTARSVTLAEIDIHPSFAEVCANDACAFTNVAASDAADIAVLVLDADLDTVPTIPVDLDPVAPADSLLTVTSSCAAFDSTPTRALHTVRATAVPATSVVYPDSPYETAPGLAARLGTSYVVTAAAAWVKGAPGVCESDIGAPLLRADAAAVAGVTSSITTYAGAKTPVTAEHTRVDAASRFAIGAWLTSLGVQTTHSCSESPGGCTTTPYDGGTPPPPLAAVAADAGAADAMAPGASDASRDAAAPDGSGATSADPPDENEGPDDSDGENSSPTKKPSPANGGCSTTPGHAGRGTLSFGIALAMLGLIARRRRRA